MAGDSGARSHMLWRHRTRHSIRAQPQRVPRGLFGAHNGVGGDGENVRGFYARYNCGRAFCNNRAAPVSVALTLSHSSPGQTMPARFKCVQKPLRPSARLFRRRHFTAPHALANIVVLQTMFLNAERPDRSEWPAGIGPRGPQSQCPGSSQPMRNPFLMCRTACRGEIVTHFGTQWQHIQTHTHARSHVGDTPDTHISQSLSTQERVI